DDAVAARARAGARVELAVDAAREAPAHERRVGVGAGGVAEIVAVAGLALVEDTVAAVGRAAGRPAALAAGAGARAVAGAAAALAGAAPLPGAREAASGARRAARVVAPAERPVRDAAAGDERCAEDRRREGEERGTAHGADRTSDARGGRDSGFHPGEARSPAQACTPARASPAHGRPHLRRTCAPGALVPRHQRARWISS